MKKIEINSKRFTLRPITFSHLNVIHKLHSLPETDEYNTLGIPENIEETKSIIQSWINENEKAIITNYTFAIELIDNTFIGLFGLKLGTPKYRKGEVWYKIHSDFWGHGYATEALNSILDFGFSKLNLHRIEAGCAVNNIASIKVLEKVGMIKEGRGRQILPLKNGWSDNFEYAIIETDKRG